jgi:tetratricopeptide (TPR) repeat protein
MSENDYYGAARENIMLELRRQVRELASQELPAAEIERRLDHGLTATESELLLNIIRHEVAYARRTHDLEATHVHSAPDAVELPPTVAEIRSMAALARPWSYFRTHYGLALAALAIFVAGVLLGSALTSGGGKRRASTSAHAGAAGKSSTRSIPASRATTTRHRSVPSAGARHRPLASRPAPEQQPPPQSATAGPPIDAASATRLNDRGFRLISSGSYDQAIPLLRRAVASYSSRTTDVTYAYALYNLGRALRLSGRPREAIPLLEQRLRIDNQRATVARELEAAQRGARRGEH